MHFLEYYSYSTDIKKIATKLKTIGGNAEITVLA